MFSQLFKVGQSTCRVMVVNQAEQFFIYRQSLLYVDLFMSFMSFLRLVLYIFWFERGSCIRGDLISKGVLHYDIGLETVILSEILH